MFSSVCPIQIGQCYGRPNWSSRSRRGSSISGKNKNRSAPAPFVTAQKQQRLVRRTLTLWPPESPSRPKPYCFYYVPSCKHQTMSFVRCSTGDCGDLLEFNTLRRVFCTPAFCVQPLEKKPVVGVEPTTLALRKLRSAVELYRPVERGYFMGRYEKFHWLSCGEGRVDTRR